MKKLLLLMLSLFATCFTAFCFTACGGYNDYLGGKQGHVHNLEYVAETPATCLEYGVMEHYRCSGCDKKFKDENGYNEIYGSLNLDKIDHDLTKVDAIASTCLEYGVIEHYNCTVCNKNFTNQYAYQELTSVQAEKPEHTHTAKFTIECCGTTDTIEVVICIECQLVVPLTEGVIHAHNYEYVGDKQATCTESGYHALFKCSNCNKQIMDKQNALGHKYVRTNVVYPTCYSDGYVLYECTRCYDKYNIVLTKRHYYEFNRTISEPDCTNSGKDEYKCHVCGNLDVRTVNPLGHKWDNGIVTKEPNCTETGLKFFECLRCDETKEEVLPIKHDWDNWQIIKQKTCTENGLRKRECKKCDAYEEEIIYACHEYDNGVITKEPTCTEDGSALYTCMVCGATDTVNVGALGHDYKEESIEPTCTKPGIVVYTCKRCEHEEFKLSSPLGHELTTCYNDTAHWSECVRCDYNANYSIHVMEYIIEENVINDGAQNLYKYALKHNCTGCPYGLIIAETEASVHYGVVLYDTKYPTCTESGYIPGLKCAVSGCNEIRIQSQQIKALGHEWYKGNCLRCGETQLNLTLSSDGEYYIVSGIGTCIEKEIEIPKYYKDKPVKEIANNAFYNNTTITSVTIGDNVKSIGNDAFYNCDKLTTVTIGNSVTSIGDYAFCRCDNLTTVTIGNSVTSIGYYAFCRCNSLTSIEIPNSVESIGDYAFSDCDSLTSVVIGDSVTSIGSSAFRSCDSLTSIMVDENNENYKSIDGNLYSKDGKTLIQYAIGKTDTVFTIPNSVTSIGGYAFSGCDSITSIEIPNSVTSISNEAFSYTGVYNNESNWDNGVLYIDNWLIDVNTSISGTYVIKEGTVDIADYAFYNCDKLTSVTIPNSVTSIGSNAFCDCSSLTSITIGNSVTSIGNNALRYCYKLEKVYYLGDINGWVQIEFNNYDSNPLYYVKNLYINNELVTEANITTATKINAYAFYNCDNLTSITIPNSVTSIGEWAFYNCDKLTSVTIPNSVTSIGDYAFEYCDSLTSIEIPNSVTSIGKGAFHGCDSLTSVVIGDSVTSIGSNAFYDCDKLVEVINKSPYITVTKGSIDNGYLGWHALSVSNCDDSYVSKVSTDSNGFVIYTNGNDKILVNYIGTNTNITIPSDITKINAYAFYNCDNLTSITIPNSVTSIGEWAFHGCDSLTSIVIPDSVTSIGRYAFKYCNKLVEVINKSPYITVTKGSSDNGNLGYYALSVSNCDDSYVSKVSTDSNGFVTYTNGNDKILVNYIGTNTNITIPSDITEINSNAFSYTGVYNNESNWDNGVLYIDNWLIDVNTSISGTYVIKEGTVDIADYAFYNCDKLTSVTIPNSVTSIGDRAFYYCTKLTSITVDGNNTAYKSIDGVLYSKDGKTLICYPAGKTATTFTIPNSVTSIGSSAFYGCRKLTSIVFEDTTPWYRTTSSSNWKNKTGGTQTSVASTSINATNFTSTYGDYYWYKL